MPIALWLHIERIKLTYFLPQDGPLSSAKAGKRFSMELRCSTNLRLFPMNVDDPVEKEELHLKK